MALLDLLRRAVVRFPQPADTGRTSAADRPAPEFGTSEPHRAFGFVGLEGESSLGSMAANELLAWENRGVPSVHRPSDRAEAASDERQDLTSGLSFPLHWTTARESVDYLFDFSIACELLGPRPDDLVLDLAAGTCWATEMLNRLGVRTVSIDLSTEMMRRGRERLATDSRLVFRHGAAFVAARGQALPFANESFDGILCMNALHHHPSYAVVLAEIHRVLKSGGRAVFSEPGTAHAEQALSQFRMREEAVMEKPVSLPHVRRLALDAGFSRMRIVPLRAASAYACEYSAAAEDQARLDQLWTDTLRHSPREHARFVLHKGGDRPLDSWLPPHHLVGRLDARILAEDAAPVVRAGEAFTDRLAITNAGSIVWRVKGRRFGGQVTCGLKVCDADGVVLREDLGRTPLPRDIGPGERIALAVTVPGALLPGRYLLRYDMVVEGVTWFEFQGSTCLVRPLEVTAS